VYSGAFKVAEILLYIIIWDIQFMIVYPLLIKHWQPYINATLRFNWNIHPITSTCYFELSYMCKNMEWQSRGMNWSINSTCAIKLFELQHIVHTY
jgi:hypothetical protein